MALGIIKQPIVFLGSNSWFQGLMIGTDVWKEFGYGAIIFIAALTSINTELYEAAAIDGCSVFKRFFLIVLPLLKPVISTVVIIVTLNVWNEFMTPLLFLQSRENDVILQEVTRNIGQFATDWTALFPMLMLGVAPLMIFYVFMQKYIIAGVAAGAVKG